VSAVVIKILIKLHTPTTDTIRLIFLDFVTLYNYIPPNAFTWYGSDKQNAVTASIEQWVTCANSVQPPGTECGLTYKMNFGFFVFTMSCYATATLLYGLVMLVYNKTLYQSGKNLFFFIFDWNGSCITRSSTTSSPFNSISSKIELQNTSDTLDIPKNPSKISKYEDADVFRDHESDKSNDSIYDKASTSST